MSEEYKNVKQNKTGESEPAKIVNRHQLKQNKNHTKSLAELAGSMNPSKSLAELAGSMNPSKSLAELAGSMNPSKSLAELAGSMNHTKSLAELAGSSLKKINNNWLLSDSVIKSISLTNNENEAREIFDKIPREKFVISQEYDEKNDVLEYVLKNNNEKYSVPLKDVASTLAVSDFLTSIKTTEIFEFYNFLVKYPMLGITHPIGKKIFEEIPKLQLTEYKKLILYRVRDRDILKNEIPFSDLEMFEAPFGIANHGRFNVIGQGELYTSSNRDVALKEIARTEEHIRYDFIKWELQKPIRLLELSNLNNPLGKYISIDKNSNANAYLVPNYISQCAKMHEITGISYVSVIDNSATNYVFFDFENNWFKTIGRDVDVKFNGEAI